MNAHIARRAARCMALPVVAAALISGAALGLAGTANAAEGTLSYHPEPRTGIVAEPKTKATPANGNGADARVSGGGLDGAPGGGGGDRGTGGKGGGGLL